MFIDRMTNGMRSQSRSNPIAKLYCSVKPFSTIRHLLFRQSFVFKYNPLILYLRLWFHFKNQTHRCRSWSWVCRCQSPSADITHYRKSIARKYTPVETVSKKLIPCRSEQCFRCPFVQITKINSFVDICKWLTQSDRLSPPKSSHHQIPNTASISAFTHTHTTLSF